jgi:hypothetical protein
VVALVAPVLGARVKGGVSGAGAALGARLLGRGRQELFTTTKSRLFLSQQLALDTEPNRAGAALLAVNVPRPFDAVLAAWKADGYSLGFDLFAAAGLDQVAVAAVRAVPCIWLNQTVGYWAFVRLQPLVFPPSSPTLSQANRCRLRSRRRSPAE